MMTRNFATILVVLLLTVQLASDRARGVDIVWVHQERGVDVPTWDDDQWRALIESNGHTIVAHDFFDDLDFDPGRVDELNAGDLVIFSRDSNSGDYNSTPEEAEAWLEGVTDPMIILTPYVLRNNRWVMVDASGTPDALEPMQALDPSHPIFAGVPLNANNEVEVWEQLGPDDNIDITDAFGPGNGTLIAQESGTEFPWIIHWEEGVEFFDGSNTFAGGPRLFLGMGSDDDPNSWGSKNITPEGDQIFLNAINFMAGVDQAVRLQAGDADQDLDFDQLDLVKVQVAAKYLTGQAATWGEGDWDGAPGGEQGNPPPGNGMFDQLDIIAALNAGTYLTGPYAAIGAGGQAGDAQTSVGYNASTGELFVDAPSGTQLTSINIDSAGGIFTGDAAQNLGGSFDNDADNNIFKATFGSSFGSLTFGNVARTGLSQDFVLNDLTVVGSLAGGGDLGPVDLIFVPEPSTAALALMCLAGIAVWHGRRSRGSNMPW